MLTIRNCINYITRGVPSSSSSSPVSASSGSTPSPSSSNTFRIDNPSSIDPTSQDNDHSHRSPSRRRLWQSMSLTPLSNLSRSSTTTTTETNDLADSNKRARHSLFSLSYLWNHNSMRMSQSSSPASSRYDHDLYDHDLDQFDHFYHENSSIDRSIYHDNTYMNRDQTSSKCQYDMFNCFESQSSGHSPSVISTYSQRESNETISYVSANEDINVSQFLHSLHIQLERRLSSASNSQNSFRMMESYDTLFYLPNHVIVEIFSYLDIHDVSSIACVSKTCNILINHDYLWKLFSHKIFYAAVPAGKTCGHL